MVFLFIIDAVWSGKKPKSPLTGQAIMDALKVDYPDTSFLSLEARTSEARAYAPRGAPTPPGHPVHEVLNGGEKRQEFQKLVTDHQQDYDTKKFPIEADGSIGMVNASDTKTDIIVVMDRFCIESMAWSFRNEDPQWIAYQRYNHWQERIDLMKKSIVIFCEPVKEWVVDNHFEIEPADAQEWIEKYEYFKGVLDIYKIPYDIMPSSLQRKAQRIAFVLACLIPYMNRFEREKKTNEEQRKESPEVKIEQDNE